jgi:hypothetical protein
LIVKGQIEYLSDLHAADCVYHRCRTGKNIPQEYSTAENKSKKPNETNEVQYEAFLKTCVYFEENDEEQF